MAESYEGDKAAPLDDGMDEFLCEYVDGAMDPVVLQAFEDLLRANPEMADHVQCLCQAKRFLATHSNCPHPTSELQDRLRAAIAREQLGSGQTGIAPRLGSFALLTSAAGLMLMLGMLFGTAVIRYQGTPPMFVERESAPSDAHPMRTATLLDGSAPVFRAAFGVPGPVMALPAYGASSRMTLLEGADSLSFAIAAP